MKGNGFFSRSLIFFCVLRVGVYRILGAGWSSNSKYALLGGLRSVAQTISYEVRLALIFISYIVIVMRYDLNTFNEYGIIFVLFLPLLICWFISILAELNRTPFDFAEGESELVSGFNVEYSGAGFALIFIAEYGSIIFLRCVTALIFRGFSFIIVKTVMVRFLVILVRGSYPRFRYDKLMHLAWKGILPGVLFYILLIFGVINILL